MEIAFIITYLYYLLLFLAFIIYYSRGVERNYGESAEYFKKSANQGNPDGQFEYGECLYYFEQNYSESARYYEKSSDQGNSDAQFKYAEIVSFFVSFRNQLEATVVLLNSGTHGMGRQYQQFRIMRHRGNMLFVQEE